MEGLLSIRAYRREQRSSLSSHNDNDGTGEQAHSQFHALNDMARLEDAHDNPIGSRRPSTSTSSIDNNNNNHEESFMAHFAHSKGAPQIVILFLLLAMAYGSTIGVVPAVVTDRYARINHNYTSIADCADYMNTNTTADQNMTMTMTATVTLSDHQKPQACLDGSNDAQNAAACSSLISNLLTFATSSLMGSLSDERGRRGIIVLGVFMSTLNPLVLVLLQLYPRMNPWYYYATSAMSGLISWIAVALSALSDVMPPKWRAACFGLVLAGFSLGFALSPVLALWMSHFGVSVFSLALSLLGFFLTACCFPETLPPEVAAAAALRRQEDASTFTSAGTIESQQRQKSLVWRSRLRTMTRPFRELSILNRSRLFRLLSALAFSSAMVTSADQTLLVYYVEEQLEFNDKDIAIMLGLFGILGVLVQGFLIKPINDCIGERLVICFAFFLGAAHNVLYGLATTKLTIFIGVCLSSFVGMSFPTISAIKSNNVEESEQGRIQGALYSVKALASALGPMALQYVYSKTKYNSYPGGGTMFIFAAFLYLIAIACAFALPKDQANSCNNTSQLNTKHCVLASVHVENDDDEKYDDSETTRQFESQELKTPLL